MKHFLLYYLTGALSAGVANAGAVECRRRAAQQSVGTDTLSLTSTDISIATPTASTTSTTASSSISTSSATLIPTTLSTTTISSSTTIPIDTTSSSTPANSVSLPNYLPIFYDDFSSPVGSLPSSTNWLFDTGVSYPNGPLDWGNNETETYSVSPTNLQITSSSTLLITPLYTTSQGWTSARIETQQSNFQCPENGKLFIQASIKLGDAPSSTQQGIWPAFWALGSSFRGNYNNWPFVSEWDIMESQNGLGYNAMTIHCGFTPGGPCNEKEGITSSTSMTRGVWNTFGFEVDRIAESWENETVSWYLNGQKKFVVDGAMVGNEDDWAMVAHEAHFLLLDVAVDSEGNAVTGDTVGGVGSGMEVKYVGVWIWEP